MGWGAFLKAVFRRDFKLAPKAWLTSIAAAIYVLSPVDLLPELLLTPLFGPVGAAGGVMDDLAVLGVAFGILLKEKKRWEAQITSGDDVRSASKGDDSDIIDVESY
jgi:uncharacterized membrane protein YkvA (DUF1232 family)